MPLTLSSLAFAHRGHIPAQYTCDGANTPPPLQWSTVPAGAKSLALIVDDPDAPDPQAPTHTFVHWVLYNLPPSTTGLDETRPLPAGTREGTNDSKRAGYIGPCPPIGCHRYFFKLYALDAMLANLGSAPKRDLEAAMRAHVIEHAELVGLYERGHLGAGRRQPR
jgi:Raf kinase inhibitor-like YbhB/YbcL family protein